VVNKDEEERVRVIVDVENYRKKREESLIKLAEKTASKVMRYKRNIALEPMNSYERHVIHSALQDWKDVSTFSSGSDPRRCVVVSYTPNGEKPPKGNRSRKG
jgi:spoIIIJ-associated protein